SPGGGEGRVHLRRPAAQRRTPAQRSGGSGGLVAGGGRPALPARLGRHPTIERGGGSKSITGWSASASRRVCATVWIDCEARPAPTALNGLSGSALNAAIASWGVYPTNQAVRLASVVPVLPATGRPTMPATSRAVDHDRKSTRLNSSHVNISYTAVCSKKRKVSVTM